VLHGDVDWTWLWIERASWIVTIVGLFLGLGTLVLLLREQRRIARELGRRPFVKLGLVIPGHKLVPQEFEVSHTFVQGASGQARLQFGFGVANEGDRTAHQLHHELIFPASIAQAWSMDGHSFTDGSGYTHVSWDPVDLHPRSGLTHYAFLSLRPNIWQVSIQASATYQDSPRVASDLDIMLQRIA